MLTDSMKGRYVVGTKQTLKAIENKSALVVIVATDAGEYVKQSVLEAAKAAGIKTVCVESMKKLGSDCGISRPAASAAVIKA